MIRKKQGNVKQKEPALTTGYAKKKSIKDKKNRKKKSVDIKKKTQIPIPDVDVECT